MEENKSRRRYIGALGTLVVSGLAGCGEESDGDTGGGGGGSSGSTSIDEPTKEPATETPTEESTPSPTEESTPSSTETGVTEGASYSFEGDGTSTTGQISFRGGIITADYTHEGEQNFIVEALAVEGDSLDDTILVNDIGSVDGGVADRVSQGEYQLNITASGTWSLSVTEPGTSNATRPPVEASGTGTQYAGPYTFDGVTTVQSTHSGQRNFIVEMFAVDGGLLDDTIVFNEVGNFDGSASARLSGIYFASVTADGDWTLSFESGENWVSLGPYPGHSPAAF